jgi:hypothetical protein
VIGWSRRRLQCCAWNEGGDDVASIDRSPRSFLLQLCGCVVANKPSDPAVNELERRHDEMMQRMGGGSGGGSM